MADYYFEQFQSYPFEQGYVRTGKEKRRSCFFSQLKNSDGSLRNYYYAGKENTPHEYPDELVVLQKYIEDTTGWAGFNSCLINEYVGGKQAIGFHSDSETSLLPDSPIFSGSLGESRWFDVESKEGVPYVYDSTHMHHGSAMVMAGDMQKNYKHRVRPEAKVTGTRYNYTFRCSK